MRQRGDKYYETETNAPRSAAHVFTPLLGCSARNLRRLCASWQTASWVDVHGQIAELRRSVWPYVPFAASRHIRADGQRQPQRPADARNSDDLILRSTQGWL